MSWATYVLIGLVVAMWINLRLFINTWRKDREALWQALNRCNLQIAELSGKLDNLKAKKEEKEEDASDSGELNLTPGILLDEGDEGAIVLE